MCMEYQTKIHDECVRISEHMWNSVMPKLDKSLHGKAIITSTPTGDVDNQFYDMWNKMGIKPHINAFESVDELNKTEQDLLNKTDVVCGNKS